MLFHLDFSVSAWVKELLIEAASERDAINKLKSMTLAEIIEEEAIIDSELDVQNIDVQVAAQDLTIRVTKADFDFSVDKMAPSVIEYLKARLPKEFVIELKGVEAKDNIEELIKDELYGLTGYDVLSTVEYEIIETK